ncbi:MAG: hypothetical protein MK073_04040 [Phycisphaerales bacterium]|nr:hypothetical protein [Phycisphaerales bacterium]
MSGIAGIVRRDGRAIPQKWLSILEKSLAIRSHKPVHTYQESIKCEHGDVQVVLMQHADPEVTRNEFGATSVRVIDGSIDDAFACASWDGERLELSYCRKGNGSCPLYTLDLGKQNDGTLFASSPMPLLQIARHMKLTPEMATSTIQQFLLQGCVSNHANLIAPVQEVKCEERIGLVGADALPPSEEVFPTAKVSEDLCNLIECFGQPLSHSAMLAKIWQYANLNVDVLPTAPTQAQVRKSLRYERLHSLMAQLPIKRRGIEIAKLWNTAFVSSLSDCMRVSDIELFTCSTLTLPTFERTHESIKEQCVSFFRDVVQDKLIECCHCAGLLSGKSIEFRVHDGTELQKLSTCRSWLANPESSLGSLAGDFFTSQEAFSGLPIDAKAVSEIYDNHLKGEDYAKQLFCLLTLGLWHRQIRQP